MVDQQYCSTEHRREARLASTRVMREEDDDQELWSVSRNRKKQQSRPGVSSNQASAVAFVTLGALLVAMVMLPGGKSSSQGTAFPPSSGPIAERGLLSRTTDSIGSFVRDRAPITLHHDFRSGLNEWVTVALNGAPKVDDPHDWKTPSVVAPGSLRLWSRSTPLRNYQMEFEGQIERRSLSWAFRASNPANYYAAKIQITRAGPQPNADLVHYVMLNGREWDRVQLPLPITLERGSDYRVRVSVQDDHFITYLNGQVISSWSDARLSRGGVGFFADQDDQQQVAWVSISERDSFMGRMLAHFGLFILPTNLQ
jgi:hypothetical protein